MSSFSYVNFIFDIQIASSGVGIETWERGYEKCGDDVCNSCVDRVDIAFIFIVKG